MNVQRKEGDIIGKSPKISVIVPVYGVEAYISECIESLKAQTFDDLEFIFVDDCSPDASMDIVYAWAAQDARVRILHNEENLGPGPTRNAGIAVARGEYLSFIDPDDYISPDFYELLWRRAEAEGFPDIVKGALYVIREDSTSNPEKKGENERNQRKLSEGAPLIAAGFSFYHQTAIYRRGLIAENGVLYGTSLRGEDNTFVLHVRIVASSLALEDNARYYLRGREGSVTRRYDTHILKEFLHAISEKVDILISYKLDQFHIEAYSVGLAATFTQFAIRVLCETGDEAAVRTCCAEAGDQFRRLLHAELITLDRPILRAACEYDIFLCYQPQNPTRGYAQAGDWHYIIREWLRFCDKCGGQYPNVRRATMRTIKNAIKSLLHSKELEGSKVERLKALHAIRGYLWRSASRRLLLKDAARAAWRKLRSIFRHQ